MSSVEQDTQVFLAADIGVQGLVGSRIFPVYAPQGSTFPLIVYSRIDTDREPGLSNDGYNGINFALLQFDCWGTSYAMAVAVADAVRHAIINKFNQNVVSHYIYMFHFSNERDEIAVPEAGQEAPYFNRQIQVRVKHSEAV